ncbi:hypothetical protein [Polaromonas jejuensis]|uniref:Uncharacterized protein n=1 Tax=Polaromonas jejuensis TaxID=457502 RepID=A0ABW0QAF1_9BURK|nr:hypothetical protein [Polaromonas jejuensis]
MRRNLVLGVSLLLVAAASFAGSANGQFSVQITLNSAGTSNNDSCVSATSSATGSSSVQVRCSANVFVNIAPVDTLGSVRFLSGFRPARDSLLPDYCRSEISRDDRAASMACRLDDQQALSASNEAGDGWKVESRLYAVNTDGEAAQTQARLRQQDDRGLLTALRIARVDGRSGPVEMLVSF